MFQAVLANTFVYVQVAKEESQSLESSGSKEVGIQASPHFMATLPSTAHLICSRSITQRHRRQGNSERTALGTKREMACHVSSESWSSCIRSAN